MESAGEFFLSRTFITEMLILTIQPWPYTQSIVIYWTQPNWLQDDS
jgi:hypothetical protein